MNQLPRIRGEERGDESGIHALHAACFPTDAEARLVGTLRTARRLTVSRVAEFGTEIVGHVAFSPVTVATGKSGLGLAPVAVLAEYRCRGIAAALIRHGLDLCRELHAGWVVVLGNPAYYARFGFRPASGFGLSDAYGGGEAFQVLELQPGAIPLNAGLVSYAPEFAVCS